LSYKVYDTHTHTHTHTRALVCCKKTKGWHTFRSDTFPQFIPCL